MAGGVKKDGCLCRAGRIPAVRRRAAKSAGERRSCPAPLRRAARRHGFPLSRLSPKRLEKRPFRAGGPDRRRLVPPEGPRAAAPGRKRDAERKAVPAGARRGRGRGCGRLSVFSAAPRALLCRLLRGGAWKGSSLAARMGAGPAAGRKPPSDGAGSGAARRFGRPPASPFSERARAGRALLPHPRPENRARSGSPAEKARSLPRKSR